MRETEPHSGLPRTRRKFGTPSQRRPSPGRVPAGRGPPLPPAPGPWLACRSRQCVRGLPVSQVGHPLAGLDWTGVQCPAPSRRPQPGAGVRPGSARVPPCSRSSQVPEDLLVSSDFKAVRSHSWKLKTTGKDQFFPLLPTPSGESLLLMLLCLYISTCFTCFVRCFACRFFFTSHFCMNIFLVTKYSSKA